MRALALNRNTVQPTEEQIRQRAYELYLAGGRQPGKDIEYWLQAEAEFDRSEPEKDTAGESPQP